MRPADHFAGALQSHASRMRGTVTTSLQQTGKEPGELSPVPPRALPPRSSEPVPKDDGEAFVAAATVKDLAGLPQQEPLVPLSRPRTVAGYAVLGELGRGGMGVVYLARQTALNRLVALKMTLSARTCGQDLERFRSEALAVARLRHPNIVQIYEVGEHDGQPFFSLEFCEGGSLEDRLTGRPLPPSQAARLVLTLAHAVQAAHEAGVVHRDLK